MLVLLALLSLFALMYMIVQLAQALDATSEDQTKKVLRKALGVFIVIFFIIVTWLAGPPKP